MAEGRSTLPQAAEAVRAIRQAVDAHRRGNFAEAEQLYSAVLAQHPREFDALHLFGLLRLQQGRHADAIALLAAALELQPSSADALEHMAGALVALGRPQEALTKLDALRAIRPRDPDVHCNSGVAYAALGRADDALAAYRNAVALRADHVPALYNLGNILAARGHDAAALDCYDKVVALAPQHFDAWNNRGTVLSRLGRHEEALASFDRVLAHNRDDLQARSNRATALKDLRRFAPALAEYEFILSIDPNHAQALYNRGNALIDLGRPAEAIASLRRALALETEVAGESSSRPHVTGVQDAAAHTSLIFALNFDATCTAAEQQAERARWARRYVHLTAAALPHRNAPNPERRLRIGYVSSHFCSQAATYAFGGVIVCHDPAKFEVVCYSDTAAEDEISARLRAAAATWHRTAALTDDALAELIRADGIDILVDCVGHMKGHRLPMFARKPAPVQVTAWGEPTGTGLKAMDYLLGDPVMAPAAVRALLVERVVDLPNYICLWTPEPLPAASPLPALARGHVTFGSFNRLSKVLEPVLRTWAQILHALPNSRLTLKDRLLDHVSQRAPALAVLAAEGISADRVTFLDQTDRAGHFAAYDGIDIALDPFPHGGGMTTLDALWMGVPVVTWPGGTISSRIAAACLTAVGLTDYVAPDPRGYVALALAKAGDLAALAGLRTQLRERMANTAIGDPARYTRTVEAAYRDMWRAWCASQRQ